MAVEIVQKRPVVKEEIRIRKDVVQDEELVEEYVRKEEVDIEDRTERGEGSERAKTADHETADRSSKGSRDEAAIVGQVLYLHTPDGFGRSELAAELSKGGKRNAAEGTARNWATVTKLLAMCEG